MYRCRIGEELSLENDEFHNNLAVVPSEEGVHAVGMSLHPPEEPEEHDDAEESPPKKEFRRKKCRKSKGFC